VVLTRDNNANYTAEADVVVNTAFRFDSYRGPLQDAAADFHRIMVHEFGHVLGLDHVTNEAPGQAIMEPIISDLDHPAFDDTYGIRQLYGAFVYYWDFPVRLRTGDSFESSLDVSANNAPTSYTITGLPPGITYDPATGLISGIATTSGRYGAVLVAHGPYADAYSAKSFNVQGFDRVQGLLGIIKINGSAMVADPARPRIYASGPDEINAIDTQSFDVTEIGSGSGGSIPFLSVSADSSLLLVTNPT